jgi:serine O-acetyltransferase
MWTEIRDDLRRHGLRGGGFWALVVYRYGRWGTARRSGWLRWCNGKGYGLFRPVVQHFSGIDLDRNTRVGRDLHVVHGGMVHIHPRAVIGDRVGIMHGVTLGTNMGEGAPIVGNDVFIGCHASVLGGVKIGDGARIAANSLVISDVPPGAVAIGVPARVSPDLSALRKDAVRPVLETRVPAAEKVEGGRATS